MSQDELERAEPLIGYLRDMPLVFESSGFNVGDYPIVFPKGDSIDVDGWVRDRTGQVVGRVHFDGRQESACWCGPVVRTEQQDDGTFVETIVHRITDGASSL